MRDLDLKTLRLFAAVVAVLTGMTGAISAKYLFNLLGIGSYAVRGFALGTAAHGIGAARAIQVDADAGAYAGIALGLQVLLASLLMPLVARWICLLYTSDAADEL